jgi:hypothetical protein
MSESAKERNARADKARRAEIERLIASGPISEDGSDWPPAAQAQAQPQAMTIERAVDLLETCVAVTASESCHDQRDQCTAHVDALRFLEYQARRAATLEAVATHPVSEMKARPPHGALILRQPRLDSMTCRVQHERDGSLDAAIAASLQARIAAGGETDLTIFSVCHRTNKLVAVYLAEFGILQLRCGEQGCLAPLMQIEVAR